MITKLVVMTALVLVLASTPLAFARHHHSDSSSSSSDNSTGGSSSDNSNNVNSLSAGYSLTVNIGTHAFGNPSVNVEAKTANGNYDQTYSVNVQNPSVTFSIPPGSGPSVQVCVSNSGISGSLFSNNCQRFDSTGSDMTVNMSPS